MVRKHTDTRDKLLCTAMTLIWRSNYTNVGVNEICKQAGVTKGSFYHYFETKADLYYAAVLNYWEQLKQEFDAIFTPDHSALEQLEGLIGMILDHAQVNGRSSYEEGGQVVVGCPVFTSGAQCGCDEDKVRLAAQEMAEHKIAYDVRLIENLKAERRLNGDPDSEQLGRQLYQYIQGLLMYCRVYNDMDCVRHDLRDGIYRLLDLKQQYRVKPVEPAADSSAA